jgi:hypothetical protein
MIEHARSVSAGNDPIEQRLAEHVAGMDVAALARRFRECEILVLEEFLPPEILHACVAETRSLMPSARRSYLPFVRKGGAISHPTIRERAPTLFAVQGSAALRLFFQRIVDGPRLDARKPDDPHASAIYAYTKPGDFIGWHYDDCGCEPEAAFSIIMGLVDRSSSVLETITFKKSRERAPVRRLIRVTPGMFVFFCGSQVWHRVTPLGRGEERATFSFVYVRDGNHPRGWEKLYLDTMNTLLYFGPKNLFKKRPDR